MAISILHQFSLPVLHGERHPDGHLGMINERILVPFQAQDSGIKVIEPRVARDDDETITAHLTIARRREGCIPIAGLRITFGEQVTLAKSMINPGPTEPFTTFSSSDNRPEAVFFDGNSVNVLLGAPAIAIISGLQSILINRYATSLKGE